MIEVKLIKRKPRRPVTVTPQILNEAFEWIAAGKTLSDFCRQPGRPDRRSIVRAIDRGGPELAERFTASRELGFDAMAESILTIADAPVPLDPHGKTDAALVQQRRLQADVRLRLLAKWCTARYGDRVQIDGAGGVNLLVVTGVPGDGAAALHAPGGVNGEVLRTADAKLIADSGKTDKAREIEELLS